MASKRPRLTMTIPEKEARRRKIRFGLIIGVLFFLVVGPLFLTLARQAKDVTLGDISSSIHRFAEQMVDRIEGVIAEKPEANVAENQSSDAQDKADLPQIVREDTPAIEQNSHETTAEPKSRPTLPSMKEIAELPSRKSKSLGGVVVNDELPRWRQLAAPSPVSPGRPRIAIVLDDMGLSQSRSLRAADLPGPLTMSFLPYGDNLQEQVDLVRNKGHEVFLHIPMEPDTPDFPGPNALLVGLDEDELYRRLQWNLTRFRGFVGVNNHMGSRFTADRNGMDLLLQELNRSGLIFLDSKTNKDTIGYPLAHKRGMPSLIRDIFIDNELDSKAIQAKLKEVEEVAREKGYVIAIGHPHTLTMEELSKWAATLADKGFTLVPVSNLLISPVSG